MEVSGEVADLMVKEGLEAAKIAAELSGKGLVNVAALLAALVKQHYKVVGKVGIERLMKDSNAESVIIPIKAEDYARFEKIGNRRLAHHFQCQLQCATQCCHGGNWLSGVEGS